MAMWWEVSSNSSRRSSWARAHHAWDLVIGISAARVASGDRARPAEPRASLARRAGCSGCYWCAPAASKRHRGCPRPPSPRRQRAGEPSAETDRSPGQCSRLPKLPPRLQRIRSAACTHANLTLPPGGGLPQHLLARRFGDAAPPARRQPARRSTGGGDRGTEGGGGGELPPGEPSLLVDPPEEEDGAGQAQAGGRKHAW